MAQVAGAETCRTVFEFLLDDLCFVASEAEPSEVLVLHLEKECLHFSAVRIVAIEAIFYRGLVDLPRIADLSGEVLVAAEASFGAVIEIEFVEVCVLDMTSLALSRHGQLRPVKMILIRDGCVAAGVHTRHRRFGACGWFAFSFGERCVCQR